MVLASGAFDGLHAGHVRYLAKAKALCLPDEPFYVAVAPDSYIAHAKGRTPPWWTQMERAETLRFCEGFTVLTQDEDTAAALIRRLKPRLFVKGTDWSLHDLPEDVRRACHAVKCGIVFVDTPGRHTRELNDVSGCRNRETIELG